jgi:signal transduction histidine kinase
MKGISFNMKILDYIKERWIPLGFAFLAFLFAFLVYRLDSGFSVRASNASYILMGWGLLFAAYLVIDVYTLNSRARKFRNFCGLNGTSEGTEEFFYPSDRANAELVREMAEEYEKYRAGIETKSAEEMEFITKWLHDAKVPIAAAKLILESQEDKLPADFYKNIHSELFSIEESILQVFYEMKTNRFFDDYKIAKTNTRKLIAQALKSYSNFFSYKKLGITVEGEDYEVLTDEKWSSYILSQIISNAVKYTPEGGKIEIWTEKDGKQATISIKNQGKGISPRDIGQVFHKGFTSSEDREGAKATGYGLFLSKKLSNLLGHSLTAESKQNEYAVFRLIFLENDNIYTGES